MRHASHDTCRAFQHQHLKIQVKMKHKMSLRHATRMQVQRHRQAHRGSAPRAETGAAGGPAAAAAAAGGRLRVARPGAGGVPGRPHHGLPAAGGRSRLRAIHRCGTRHACCGLRLVPHICAGVHEHSCDQCSLDAAQAGRWSLRCCRGCTRCTASTTGEGFTGSMRILAFVLSKSLQFGMNVLMSD